MRRVNNFWAELKKPVLALAPMANVTDAAFRRIIAKYGKPDVFWTEFVSVEGLLSKGRERLLMDFWYAEEERPIVAQVFGSKPEKFKKVAELIAELGFDGIDINMGCPDRGVERSGSGAALIKNPRLAQQIIKAAQSAGLAVSVKTRLGYNKMEIETWLPALLETGIAALIVHLRTRKEMSKVSAHWELVPKIKDLRDKMFEGEEQKPLIIGNGDVLSAAEARLKAKQFGIDGVMIGRGIFGNPWLFSSREPSIEERLRVCVEHTKLFEKLYLKDEKRLKNFDVMKKHYKAYINGFEGAKELRVKLMSCKDSAAVEREVDEWLKSKRRPC